MLRLRSKTPRQQANGRMARRSNRHSRLSMETLESRNLLASNLAFIQGAVFHDQDLDGTQDAGEPGLAGVQIQLTGTNDLGQSINTTNASDANGIYRFESLRPGTYQLNQVSTPAGFTAPAGSLGTVTITSAQSDGSPGLNIDTFDDTTQSVMASFTTVNQQSTFSPAAPEAVGLERDLFVQLTSATGRVTLSANSDVPGHLDFGTISGSAGVGRVVWDGADNNATALDEDGLGGVDLTTNNADRLQLLAGTELGGEVVIRVYTDDSNMSESNFAIPATAMALATAQVSIPYASFQAMTGGGADFSNVGAIELILTPNEVADGRIDTIATFGPTLVPGPGAANTSSIDLRLNKTVSNDAPLLGDTVNWMLSVSNDGPANATGVQVLDALPAGLTFVNSTPSQGNYNSGTGIWNVGNLNAGTTATLQITTTVDTPGKKTNTAQVSAANETDVDSTPGNSVPTEDDQAMAMLTPNITSGIDVEKSTNGVDADVAGTGPTVFVGALVEFTYRVRNTGNVPLSNIQVLDDNGTTANAADDFFATYISGDTDNDNLLDTNEQWLYRATRVATAGSYTNKATATAVDPGNAQVMDMDTSNHLGVALPMVESKRRFLASSFR